MIKKLNSDLLASIFILIIAIGLTACHQATPSLQLLSGKSIKLQDLKGRWVYINYWASWCKPCVQEIETFNALYKLEKQEQIAVFAVNYDALAMDELKSLIKTQHILYPHFADDPAVAWQLGDVQAVPVTFIINPKGQLVKTLYGEQSLKILLDQRQ